MISGLVIRAADPGEAERLGEIGFDAWAGSAFAAHDEGRADRVALRAEFIAFCTEHWDKVRVATLGGEPLGWGAREHGDATIGDLWVAPDAQGRGVGNALLVAMEDDIRKAGFSSAELETHARNHGAVRFYERNGYAIVWREDRFSKSLGYTIDKVGFSKPLRND